MYEVILTQEAHRQYHGADLPLARKLNRCFENLARNPHVHPNIKRLSGNLLDRWRYRAGDWRVVYRIDEQRKEVVVLLVVHRKDAYR